MNDTYAIVENGIVINMILWDGDAEQWQPPDGTTAVVVPSGIFATIGSTWGGKAFAEPVSST